MKVQHYEIKGLLGKNDFRKKLSNNNELTLGNAHVYYWKQRFITLQHSFGECNLSREQKQREEICELGVKETLRDGKFQSTCSAQISLTKKQRLAASIISNN